LPLPLTPNGKLDRGALPAPDRASFAVAAYTPPRNQLEQQIAQIWKAVLQIERVGIHDSFFDLGGHSLLLIRMRGQLRQHLGLDVSLTEVLRYPTIQALAQYLSGGADHLAEGAQRRIEARREARQGLAQHRQARGRQAAEVSTAGDDE
jgi:acyl carrier protein